jgi:hypothetical protein
MGAPEVRAPRHRPPGLTHQRDAVHSSPRGGLRLIDLQGGRAGAGAGRAFLRLKRGADIADDRQLMPAFRHLG